MSMSLEQAKAVLAAAEKEKVGLEQQIKTAKEARETFLANPQNAAVLEEERRLATVVHELTDKLSALHDKLA